MWENARGILLNNCRRRLRPTFVYSRIFQGRRETSFIPCRRRCGKAKVVSLLFLSRLLWRLTHPWTAETPNQTFLPFSLVTTRALKSPRPVFFFKSSLLALSRTLNQRENIFPPPASQRRPCSNILINFPFSFGVSGGRTQHFFGSHNFCRHALL